MVKHTLFLVHGMGRHEGAQWSDEVWEKLVECSKRYSHFESRKALDEYAEPVPIGYDEHFRAALQRWDQAAVSFGEFAGTNELRHADSLDWLQGVAGDEAGFGLSHVADVVIYRFFRHEAGRIQDNVKLGIFREVVNRREQDADSQFSVMAHSLGTSVTHDALAEIGSQAEIDGRANTIGTENFRFRSIHMLANVSRILQTAPKAYESVVRPGPNSTQKRYCNRMYCHRHELDPFPRPKAFEPVSWGTGMETNVLRHYRGWNVHGWLHYLDHPRVHIPILRSIAKPSAVSPKQERTAVGDYPQFGGDLENVDQARAKIGELHALAQGLDEDKGLMENYAVLQSMWAALGSLKDLVGETWSKLEGSVA